MLCHVWLISPEGLFLCEGKWRRGYGERRGGENWEEQREGKLQPRCLYERRRINKKEKSKHASRVTKDYVAPDWRVAHRFWSCRGPDGGVQPSVTPVPGV